MKYVQVNVFGCLNTFIMTVLVDLYWVMGAAMFVCGIYNTQIHPLLPKHVKLSLW